MNAVRGLVRHGFQVLDKFPFVQLLVVADLPGNKLVVDGG